jgi:hypothetical protein
MSPAHSGESVNPDRDYTRQAAQCIGWLKFLCDAAERIGGSDPVPDDTVRGVLEKLADAIEVLQAGTGAANGTQAAANRFVLSIAKVVWRQVRSPQDLRGWTPPRKVYQVVDELQRQREAQTREFVRLRNARCANQIELRQWCQDALAWLSRFLDDNNIPSWARDLQGCEPIASKAW